MRVVHAFAPVIAPDAEILFLGTMPSPQSIRNGFYYSHPQNRFWPLVAALYGEPAVPVTPEEKRACAVRNRFALWDVLAACDIRGAADASIRNPVPNDIAGLLRTHALRTVFTTGKTAFTLYERLVFPATGRHAVCLPSTSPANRAHYPFPKLLEAWRDALFLKEIRMQA